MSASSPPNSVRTLDLDGGGLLVLAGPDNEVQITLADAGGEGGTVTLSPLAVYQLQAALLDRVLWIEARRGKSCWQVCR